MPRVPRDLHRPGQDAVVCGACRAVLGYKPSPDGTSGVTTTFCDACFAERYGDDAEVTV